MATDRRGSPSPRANEFRANGSHAGGSHADSQGTDDHEFNKRGIVGLMAVHNQGRVIGSGVLWARKQVETVVVVVIEAPFIRDNTVVVAKDAGAAVVKLAKENRKGDALHLGLKRALLKRNVQAIVLLDVEKWRDDEEIQALVTPILHDRVDLVLGKSVLSGGSESPLWRQVSRHARTSINSLVFGSETDFRSGVYALSPKAARCFLRTTRRHWVPWETDLQFIIRKHNLKTLEVPNVHKRPAKPSARQQRTRRLDAILYLVVKMNPRLSIGIPSLLLLIVALVSGVMSGRADAPTQDLAVVNALSTALMTVVGAIGLLAAFVLHSVRTLLISSPAERMPAPTGTTQAPGAAYAHPPSPPAGETPEDHQSHPGP